MTGPLVDKLAGKVALITGASSGLGEATALALVDVGVRVALVARRQDRLKALQERIVADGGTAEVFVADVSSQEQAFAAATWAAEVFGVVDILVNNAGIIRPGRIADQDPAQWRETFDINLLAPLYMSQAVLPGMMAQGRGHIVNISSNAAKMQGGATQGSYAASKHAMTAWSSSLRKEVSGQGVRVTIIEPGTTATEVADSIPDQQTRQFMDEYIHKESSMQAEDIAAAIVYAVSQPQRVNVDEIWLTPTHK